MSRKMSLFITNEATKYWKKEIKNGRLQIANYNGFYYVLNGYNAFKIPAWSFFWSELIQPAAMLAPPEEGKAYIWNNGRMSEGPAADTAQTVERTAELVKNPATRTPFSYDNKGYLCRLYKLQNGQTGGINVKYDSMVNHSIRHTLKMDSPVGVAMLTSGEDADQWTALLMPMRCPDLVEDLERLSK